MQRERKLEDGDEIDINAAVDYLIDLRLGRDPDPRITMRNRLKTRDLAVLILLDLSESTNDPAPTGEQSILGLTRDASALLSRVLSDIGDPFALDGFCSDGRGDVKYFPLETLRDAVRRHGQDAACRDEGRHFRRGWARPCAMRAPNCAASRRRKS